GPNQGGYLIGVVLAVSVHKDQAVVVVVDCIPKSTFYSPSFSHPGSVRDHGRSSIPGDLHGIACTPVIYHEDLIDVRPGHQDNRTDRNLFVETGNRCKRSLITPPAGPGGGRFNGLVHHPPVSGGRRRPQRVDLLLDLTPKGRNMYLTFL